MTVNAEVVYGLLGQEPLCNCCVSVKTYIADHLDPSGLLDGTENPTEQLAAFDEMFASEGGAGITLAQMEAYLSWIAERAS